MNDILRITTFFFFLSNFFTSLYRPIQLFIFRIYINDKSYQDVQRTSDDTRRQIDILVTQLNTLDSTVQDRHEALESTHRRLENYVNDVTEKCVSLEAHHELEIKINTLEQQIEVLRQPPPPVLHDNRIDILMHRLEDFENSWSATTLESVEKTSMRLLAMEQRLDGVARTQKEYIQRSGLSRRTEDRQIETNTKTIEILEEETRSVKRQLTETLKMFSKRREMMGSPAILTRSR